MGEMKERRPVHVGGVIISGGGNVTQTDPGAQRPSRITLEDCANALDVSIPTIPAPYVAEKFADATFATYQTNPAAPSLEAALVATKRFCRMVHKGKAPMLALIGSTGTGKSHLLYSAAKALHATEHRVFTRPWYLLADQLRYGGGPSLFNPQIRLESHELRDALMKERILMIDEVRPTAGTDFDDNELAKLVCNAWDNGRAVLITTNVSPLEAVVGPAVASRFTQVTITGPDHRQGDGHMTSS
jgi:chromosomal replication initiation ATPase DnaA